MATVNDMHPGERAIIKSVMGNGSLHQRLREMGLMEGFSIEFIRSAPLGDPLEVLIQDYYLSIRRAEAALIEIHNEAALEPALAET